ncbi:ec56 protein [Colletotrichum incanum]|uniref:Ec56 protein n=1 Tax=Colletotrichum incanum TaxID=1573173 RepID=A0A166VRA7_COLIC|nr:ec56 protein [Colletotrichum incanum]
MVIGAVASLASASTIPVDLKSEDSVSSVPPAHRLSYREAQEGQGDENTWFKDRFCASGYASCGRVNTDGGPGNRCALECQNFAGGVAFGYCQCSRGWFPDECITLGKYSGRHKC